MKKTKANQTFCDQQIARLQSTNFFNALSTLAVHDLSRVLMASAVDQAQAELGITLWLDNNEEYPKCSQLAAHFRTMNEAIASTLPDACELCAPYNGNWMFATGMSKGVFANEEVTGLRRCTCERGIALKAADARRAGDAPAPKADFRRACTPDEATFFESLQAELKPKEKVQ